MICLCGELETTVCVLHIKIRKHLINFLFGNVALCTKLNLTIYCAIQDFAFVSINKMKCESSNTKTAKKEKQY